MYRWRKLEGEEQRKVLAWRQQMRRPLHSVPHMDLGQRSYLVTAACFEHQPHIGYTTERMNAFTQEWLTVLITHSVCIHAWVVLPNHYHALLTTGDIIGTLKALGRLHGATSFRWNGEEETRGRQVWCNVTETAIKSDAHHHATQNYIHHNPVKHRYTAKWTEWPWSSAQEYLSEVGREEVSRLWKEYPIGDFGLGWDDADL